MKQLLVCNCCGDESLAPVSQYVLKEKMNEVVAGVTAAAAEIDAEILYFLPQGFEIDGLQGEIRYGTQSVVTQNPYAILQELKGNLPRPMIEDGFVAVFEDKEINVISPEEAYRKANGKNSKFICIRKDGTVSFVEAEFGTDLSTVVDAQGAKAVLIGGMRGTFALPEKLSQYQVAADCLFDSVTVYAPSDCMVDTTAKLMEESWKTSCGKCVLCREGTLQYKTITSEMTLGKAKVTDPDMIRETGELIQLGAYCEFGRKMPTPLISALDLFPAEFEEHIKKKSCSAGVCYKKGDIFVILPDLCVGCGDCIDECDEDAITGKKGFIHMIDQDMCEHCGKCVPACEESAIIIVDGKMPKLPKKLTKVGKF